MALTLENLDKKCFEDLVLEARKQIPIHAPQWTDYNIQDPGITFIELFSWLVDMQFYRLNKITPGLLRKFLKLMGYPGLKPARAAEVGLIFQSLTAEPVIIPAGTKAAAKHHDTDEDIVFETREELVLENPGEFKTVSARQVDTLKAYYDSPGLPDFSIQLPKRPVLEISLKIVEEGKKQKTWRQVEDLDGSGPGDRHYTLDSNQGRIGFGDGLNGRIPPEGDQNIMISYLSGGGSRGNVPTHSITRVLGDMSAKVRVDNPGAAVNGEDAQTLAQAIRELRKDMKTVYRAVTTHDYEYLAVSTPGHLVARAKALPGYMPYSHQRIPGLVTVIVVPRDLDPRVLENTTEWLRLPHLLSLPFAALHFMKSIEEILEKVYRHLDAHRLLATRLAVMLVDYVKIDVSAAVVIKPGFSKKTVKTAVEDQLNWYLHPLDGGPEGRGWPFGRPVYPSEIFNVIHKAKGVDYVKGETLKLSAGDKGKADASGGIIIPRHSLVRPGGHTVTTIEGENAEKDEAGNGKGI